MCYLKPGSASSNQLKLELEYLEEWPSFLLGSKVHCSQVKSKASMNGLTAAAGYLSCHFQ